MASTSAAASAGSSCDFWHHAAPCHVAGVLASGLRDQLAAEARPDPVGTHQQVDAFGGVLGEVDHHVIVRRRPPGRLVPEQIPVVAEAGQQRTVDRVPRAEPVRLGDVVGDGSVAREVPDALGGDADGVEVDVGALDEIAGAVREETDPRAALFQHGAGAFVDGDVESGIAQDQRRRQPAQRPPDDRDPAGRHHLYVMARSHVTACRTWRPGRRRIRTGSAARRSTDPAARTEGRCSCTSSRSDRRVP